MLHALYERGIVPDVIVGTSVGAINGAFIASRPQTVQTARELAAIWRGLRRGQIFPLNFLLGLLGFMGALDHLVPGSSLRKLVAEHDHGQHLEEMPIEFRVVAVDVLTGEELLLSTGPALPSWPALRFRRSCRLSSGVASSWTAAWPTTRRSRMRWRRAPARSTCCPRGTRAPSSCALGMALHALSQLTHSRLIADVELHRDRAKLVVLPPPCPLAIQPIDFAHADELIARSLSDARKFLDAGGAERPPIRMRMRRDEQPRNRKNRPGGVAH